MRDRGSIHISILDANRADGEPLQLSTREQGNITVVDVAKLCRLVSKRCFMLQKCVLILRTKSVENLVEVVQRAAALEEELDALVGRADRPGDLVNILGLDNSLEVVLQKLGEVV